MGEQPWVPTRAELEREAYEDHMRDTYEGRFHEYCWAHHLDPESTESAVEYEEWFAEQEPNDGGSAGWGYI